MRSCISKCPCDLHEQREEEEKYEDEDEDEDEGATRLAYFRCGAVCDPLTEASVPILTTLRPVFCVIYQCLLPVLYRVIGTSMINYWSARRIATIQTPSCTSMGGPTKTVPRPGSAPNPCLPPITVSNGRHWERLRLGRSVSIAAAPLVFDHSG